MSCKHGNHEDACDICDEVDAAYESGLAARFAAPAVANGAEIPKWIDDQKGKDPMIDDMIAYIEVQHRTVLGAVATAKNANDTAVELLRQRDEARAAIAASTQQAAPKIPSDTDTNRLDFMIKHDAFIVKVADSGTFLGFQLMNQNEYEEYIELSGEGEVFKTERAAIDMAMEIAAALASVPTAPQA